MTPPETHLGAPPLRPPAPPPGPAQSIRPPEKKLPGRPPKSLWDPGDVRAGLLEAVKYLDATARQRVRTVLAEPASAERYLTLAGELDALDAAARTLRAYTGRFV